MRKLRHVLHIPLVTPKSLPQLRSSMQLLMKDPLVSGLPREYFCPLSYLRIHIGLLSLESPKRVRDAVEILRHINLNKILDDITRSSSKSVAPTLGTIDSNVSPSENDLSTTDSVSDSPTPRLTVKINKLFASHMRMFGSPNQKPHFTKFPSFFADVIEPTSRLEAFHDAIRLEWKNAGLLVDSETGKHPLYKSHKLINFIGPEQARSLAFRKLERPKAESLMEIDAKYKDFEWTEEFPLEKLTIGALEQSSGHHPPKSFLALARHSEIASVPLPGAKEDMSQMDEIQRDLTIADLAREGLGT